MRSKSKNIFVNIVFSLLALAIALIPTWVFLIIKAAVNPEGFWQKFAVYGAGFYVLGAVQLALFFMFLFVMFFVWFD